jgi:rRNA processing protein Gar1
MREVYVAIRPFSSGPRCSRNIRSSLLWSHLKKKMRNRGFRERKELRKRATMEDKEGE